MADSICAAASWQKQKLFFSPEFDALPREVKKEMKEICILTAQKLKCTFLIGFHDSGDVYFKTVCEQDCIDFDEIGAELEVKRIVQEKETLLASLKLWYAVYKFPRENEKNGL